MHVPYFLNASYSPGLHFHCLSCKLEFEFHLQHFECNNDVISIFGLQKHLLLHIEPCEFLEIFSSFSPFGHSFLPNVFLI